MKLSEISVRRPSFGAVVALLLATLGAAALFRLPIREFPDVDPPVVSVSVVHPGASAEVVERDVTQVIEDNLSGIEDVEQIRSTTRAGLAQINIEFTLGRDLDSAAADVRDRVSAVRSDLPYEIDEPTISKAASQAQAMMWITLTSEKQDRRALTDYAIRHLVDPLSIISGVA
jgi:multidrug efflux pump